MKEISIKSLYLIFIICIGLIFLGVGSTYAVFTASAEIDSPITLVSNLTYDGDIIEVVEIKVGENNYNWNVLNITNDSEESLNYTLWYLEDEDIEVISVEGSPNGTIISGESTSVKVGVRNFKKESITVSIGISSNDDSIVLGSNMKQIKEASFIVGISETEITSGDNSFLGSPLARNQISTLTFIDNVNVPTDYTSYDLSKYGTNKVIMWYGTPDESGLYDVYIGSSNGKTYFDNGKYLFSYLTNCTSINFNNLINTSWTIWMTSMFENCENIENLDVSSFETSMVIGVSWMFSRCLKLSSLDLSNFDTSNVYYAGLNGMFAHCESLVSLDLNSFNTSKVRSMGETFSNCLSLEELNLSSFDTSNVASMSHTFSNCRSLKNLDLSNFDTSNVTTMSHMFHYCTSLTEIDISNFSTIKVTSMSNMFNACDSLQKINLLNFDTSNVTNMNHMFFSCDNLEVLDLSSFNTTNVTNTLSMFESSHNLSTIIISDLWNMENVTESDHMFYGCTSLVGGAGTTFNSSYIDKTYARVDGGTTSPGYLTLKTT